MDGVAKLFISSVILGLFCLFTKKQEHQLKVLEILLVLTI